MTVTYADNKQTHEESVREELQALGETLGNSPLLRTQRDKLIVDAYYSGMTQMEVAALAHIDQSAVSRVITAHRRDSLLRSAQQTVQDRTEGETTMTTTSTSVVDDAKRTYERAEREFNRVINNTSDPKLIRAASAKLKETYHTWRTLQGA
ncbi:hypothetical protein [Mycolicibacterium fallax]|uniref:hypothetical protein n=1 Tax=Mycolicibacterium fallax TaxID=1793 RepID=UPI0010549E80|nr:hypothetical protein [Mycolicibacterium fallax]BBY98358.1 hypothetical protein MFAL_18250 [Mycolicibacterium fallax]